MGFLCHSSIYVEYSMTDMYCTLSNKKRNYARNAQSNTKYVIFGWSTMPEMKPVCCHSFVSCLFSQSSLSPSCCFSLPTLSFPYCFLFLPTLSVSQPVIHCNLVSSMRVIVTNMTRLGIPFSSPVNRVSRVVSVNIKWRPNKVVLVTLGFGKQVLLATQWVGYISMIA